MQEIDYQFVKNFCAESEVGDICVLVQFKPYKVKKGTKNNPSPFYDRDELLNVTNESERYLVSTMRGVQFEYGKKYESVVEEGHVFMTAEEKAEKKEKPDASCPILSRNKLTDVYCVDVVSPQKMNVPTAYFLKSSDGFTKMTKEDVDTRLAPWMPAPGKPGDMLFMQYALGTCACLMNVTKGHLYFNPEYMKYGIELSEGEEPNPVGSEIKSICSIASTLVG